MTVETDICVLVLGDTRLGKLAFMGRLRGYHYHHHRVLAADFVGYGMM